MMDKGILQSIFDIGGPLLVLTTLFFFYRKVYYHLMFIRLKSAELQSRTMLEIIVNPITIIGHIYVLIPIFIKFERRKEGEELYLESKISNSLRTFWILFGVSIFIMTILTGLIEKAI
jgi:hypothetical protein